ncbi:MAG: DUF4386 domain-containing protein [Caldilineaceae bacterium]|nr:DUF4386 domain-containing protein [Caldilineaceae bacterium]
MLSHKTAARMFGIFFIIAFLSYGIGGAIVDSIVTVPDFLTNVSNSRMLIVVGVSLMALVHSFVNIGLPVIMLPILKPFNDRLAYGLLSLAIAATTVLIVGTIFVLLLLPLSDAYINAGSAAVSSFETMGTLLVNGNSLSYHMGMALWAIGGLMFVSVLYISKLIPRPMSVWGMIGYATLLVGSILLLSGPNGAIEVASVAPGGLFEITLSIWLIVKGFNSSAIASLSAK